jgi:hypothetical protein
LRQDVLDFTIAVKDAADDPVLLRSNVAEVAKNVEKRFTVSGPLWTVNQPSVVGSCGR